jgi:DNA polymerase (family 10)
MDNPTMARLLAETADLLEIDGGDSFRIRSYRRAAEAAEQTTVNLTAAAADTARLLEIPGIGKSMATNLQAIAATGTLPLREELLAKYGAGLLELLKLPGMGPKTVALFWSAAQISSIDALAEAIEAGRLASLPRMGEKQLEKLRKGIEDYRRSAGRYRIDVAEDAATRISESLLAFPVFTTSSPREKIKSASTLAPAFRWTSACCPRSATARRCNTLPAPRRTTCRCASEPSRWATRSASGPWPVSTTNPS